MYEWLYGVLKSFHLFIHVLYDLHIYTSLVINYFTMLNTDVILSSLEFLDFRQIYTLFQICKEWKKILSNGNCRVWNCLDRLLSNIKTFDPLMLNMENNMLYFQNSSI